MSFFALVKKRYSVREFTNQKVEKEKIKKILKTANLAPSAVNYQPWHFIVITEEGLKKSIAKAYPRSWFQEAPVIIAACGDHSQSWKRRDGKDHCDVDVAIAVDHLTLAAADQGLGTCWVCAFDARMVEEVLKLPSHLEAVALIPLGYPQKTEAPEKKRKDWDEIVSWNGYQG